ncbi:hypothetical protein EVAR_37626_1 [Eumeta japonica]|uniref:Uncharacterized protein n=1 Tax=Eumeta variegata TaxID=151549 RepID=A0A4C1VQY5_EUMVA|nr:hypothetical protein EVAR_37626_1 [Eumeta japonica]
MMVLTRVTADAVTTSGAEELACFSSHGTGSSIRLQLQAHRGVTPRLSRLQHENGPAQSVQHQILIKYRCGVTTSTVALRQVRESSGGLPPPPPLNPLPFLKPSHAILTQVTDNSLVTPLRLRVCMAMTTYSLVASKLVNPSKMP